MAKVHDYEIISYEVNLTNQKIIIHAESSDSTLVSKINIVFVDVLSHFFENQLNGSIILDIEKYEISQFIIDNVDLLKKQKNYCWPMNYDTDQDLIEKLLKEHYSYYVISSSYGLNGWVLAKKYETIALN